MNHRFLIGGLITMGLGISVALAQSLLGDLLDSGGKKLPKLDVVAALSGATLSGQSKAGGMIQIDFKPDGSYAGTVQSPQGKSGGIFGTWRVDDSGKVCTDFTNWLGRKDSNCAYFYKNGDQYYISDSDTDRSTLVLKRTLKK